MTLVDTPNLRVSETDFQAAVIDLARYAQWKVAHFRAARTEKGWRTPVSADGAGYPDLTLVRAPELLIVELKAERGKLSDAQRAWLQAIHMCDIEIAVWRPSQWAEIETRLTRPRQRVRNSGRIHWNGVEMARGP